MHYDLTAEQFVDYQTRFVSELGIAVVGMFSVVVGAVRMVAITVIVIVAFTATERKQATDQHGPETRRTHCLSPMNL